MAVVGGITGEEGADGKMSRRSGNLVQSGKGGGFPGVGWVISAALDDWDERLSFPVA